VSFFLKNISKVNGVFNLTDGYNPSIIELTNFISKQLDVKKPLVLPLFIFKFLALIGDKIYTKFPFNSVKLEKLTNTLTFDDSKARTFLGWRPNEVLNSFFLNC
jgi:nucleoside-diphosphate-sugar epimerase